MRISAFNARVHRAKRCAGILSVVTAAYFATTSLVQVFSGYAIPGFQLAFNEVPALILLVALVIFISSIRHTQGAEQRRIVLLAISAIVGNATILISAVSPTVFFTEGQNRLAYVGFVAMAVGLAYGVLVERMFDIGFVVNRAVVFAATSGLVVLAFITIEWFVEKLVAGIGHVGSSIVELGLAIAVGLGLRPVHERANILIDTVFFAARHRAANALLRFADECSESRSVDALVALTRERLAVYARPAACTLYLANDEGDLIATAQSEEFPPFFPADDATTIRLRTSREVIERHDFPMLSVADYAFPMTRRGGLAGAILIALPERSEPYTPEERDAIATVARTVGTIIVALEAATVQRLTAENIVLRERLTIAESRLIIPSQSART